MRRAKGTGTIEVFRGKYRATFPFKKGKRDVVGVFDRYEDAQKALEAVLVQLGTLTGGVRGVQLKRLAEKYFAQRRSQGYASVDSEEERWRNYFEDHDIAERPVNDIRKGEVIDAILSFKRVKPPAGGLLSLSTRKNILNLIRGILKVAVDDKLVEYNVLADAHFADPKGKEKRKKKAKRALTWEQFVLLYEISKRAPEIPVAIWTGCRQGELRSLHWRDVHNVEGSKCTCDDPRDDPHIVIRYGRPPTVFDGPDDCTTKSGEPRIVSLFGHGLEAFRTMNRRVKRNPKGIVFVSRLGAYRAKGRLVGRLAWNTWKQASGLLWLRWHDLRHTCGTWLVQGTLGTAWSLEAVKEHLGHSELKTTERYADQRGGARAAAAAAAMRADKPSISHQRSG